MTGKIILGQVLLCPMKQSIEVLTIIRDKGKEHPVCLPFRRSAVARVVINHAHLIVHKAGNVALPQ